MRGPVGRQRRLLLSFRALRGRSRGLCGRRREVVSGVLTVFVVGWAFVLMAGDLEIGSYGRMSRGMQLVGGER